MKHMAYSLWILVLLFLGGCAEENLSTQDSQPYAAGEVTVRFSAEIPDFTTVLTRANGGVGDLFLLVFDNNGLFIARRQATLSSQTDTGGNFTASLPSSTNPRTIHFVSNFDWDDFDDNAMLGVNETAVIGLMATQNATFWARVELSSGISEDCFDNTTVELLRNQAKISVTSEAPNFTYQGFTVHNTPDIGTVAPYSVANGFQIGTITETAGMALLPAEESNISNDEKRLFERKNASASEITTIIVKGTYEGASYFYKIDLIDTDKNRYDLERNFHYAVKIKTVTRAGYTNFSDALAGASHNNTALDPIIEKYPIISDGTSKLQVEKTLIILTQPNQSFSVWAKYFPDINDDTFDNTDVTVSIESGNEAIDGTTLSFNAATGAITATGLGNLPDEPAEARIKVTKGDLSRIIRVVLREPFSFDPVTINNDSPATLTNGQSEDAVLRFNIPNDFSEDLFPLPVNIYTQGLYPAASGLEMVVEGGVIHYIYRATAKGQQTINFKTNKSNNVETVTLKADYFTDGTVEYDVVPDYIFEGTIQYYSSSGMEGSGWRDVPANGDISIVSGPGSIEMTSEGHYRYTVAGTTPDDTEIQFRYRRNRNNYYQTKTISELKTDSDLELERN